MARARGERGRRCGGGQRAWRASLVTELEWAGQRLVDPDFARRCGWGWATVREALGVRVEGSVEDVASSQQGLRGEAVVYVVWRAQPE